MLLLFFCPERAHIPRGRTSSVAMIFAFLSFPSLLFLVREVLSIIAHLVWVFK